jgi:hypothetical protein
LLFKYLACLTYIKQKNINSKMNTNSPILLMPFLIRYTGVSPDLYRTYLTHPDGEIERIIDDEERVEALKQSEFTHRLYRNYAKDGSGLILYTTKDFWENRYASSDPNVTTPTTEESGSVVTQETPKHALYSNFHVSIAGDPHAARFLCEQLSSGWKLLTPVTAQVEMVYSLENTQN